MNSDQRQLFIILGCAILLIVFCCVVSIVGGFMVYQSGGFEEIIRQLPSQ